MKAFILIIVALLGVLLFSACQTEKDLPTYNISFLAGEGGTILGEQFQTVERGKNTSTVTAVSNEGYYFLKWSDNNSTQAIRYLSDVAEDINATAIFSRLEFVVKYFADIGGHILDDNGRMSDSSRTVFYGEAAETIIATPEQGFIFVNWSDNSSTNPIRTDLNVTCDITAKAVFGRITYLVNYNTDGNGYIENSTNQTVKHGNSAASITAVPNEGYRFFEWSDNGNSNPVRTDFDVCADINATAIFEKIVNTYVYQYNNATENNFEKHVELSYEDFNQTNFTVPKRINSTFAGWYLDKNLSVRVSDESGKIVIGSEIFNYISLHLYAKWETIEKVNYKILLVFITEIYAVLPAPSGIITVDYKMSVAEKNACDEIALTFSNELNETFAGLVNFQVDKYFTTEPLTAENFSPQSSSELRNCYIMGNDIPEIKELLFEYRSIITTLSMNDVNGLLHAASGTANAKYACVNFEIGRHISIKNWVEIYLHEFAHTVEMAIDAYDYHKAIRGAENADEATKLYLKNKLSIDDVNVGIPYSFWKGEFIISFKKGFFDDEPYVINAKYGDSLQEILSNIYYVPIFEGRNFLYWYMPYGLTALENSFIERNLEFWAAWA